MDIVVIGLGYVGLPLAREACRAGLSVGGLDSNPDRVEGLLAGRSPVGDVSHADIREMLRGGFKASADASILDAANAVTICVPTPLSPEGMPDLTAVRCAAAEVADHLSPGMLVVLESTTYPGTTDDIVRPILEQSGLIAGVDFQLAYSPERIDPGNTQYGLRNTPKVVAGLTPNCTIAAASLYGKIVDSVVIAKGLREAETAKLLENIYRHVNIALINEMAMFCDDLGIDIWDAIACAATKPFGFQPFHPGPGVGGHCIPVDPSYLSYKVRSLGYTFRFVELACEVNTKMPGYVVGRAQRMLNTTGKALNGARVSILGITYKADVADQRESPAFLVARRLRALGAKLVFHDPYADTWEIDGVAVPRASDPLEMVADADLSILLTPHLDYRRSELAQRARLILDTRGVFDAASNIELL